MKGDEDEDDRARLAPPLELVEAVVREMNAGAVDCVWFYMKPTAAGVFHCRCDPRGPVGVQAERITAMVRTDPEPMAAEFLVGQCEACTRFYWDFVGPVSTQRERRTRVGSGRTPTRGDE